MKGKALRRALASDALRVNANVPLIVDTTELITPELAKQMLQQNTKNRPVNWRKVDEYAEIMRSGRWRLHGQGVILDTQGNILTGQKRLWAVIKSGVNVYMRVSRGNPADTATVIDRGTPQSARDLAARETGRVHSPTETSIARALLILRNQNRPSPDDIAEILQTMARPLSTVIAGTRGSKKTRELLMICAALLDRYGDQVQPALLQLPILVDQLRTALLPRTAAECWGHGAAFSLAMEQARRLVAKLSL